MDQGLPLLSSLNEHLGEPTGFDNDPESGFEAIFDDRTTGTKLQNSIRLTEFLILKRLFFHLQQ